MKQVRCMKSRYMFVRLIIKRECSSVISVHVPGMERTGEEREEF